MNIETLEKVKRCYEHLQDLNSSIDFLQQQAEYIKDGNFVVKLSLTSKPVDYGQGVQEKVEFDSGSVLPFYAQLIKAVQEVEEKKVAEKAKMLTSNMDITDVATLRILQVLIDEKIKERDSYTQILKNLGICFPEDVLK